MIQPRFARRWSFIMKYFRRMKKWEVRLWRKEFSITLTKSSPRMRQKGFGALNDHCMQKYVTYRVFCASIFGGKHIDKYTFTFCVYYHTPASSPLWERQENYYEYLNEHWLHIYVVLLCFTFLIGISGYILYILYFLSSKHCFDFFIFCPSLCLFWPRTCNNWITTTGTDVTVQTAKPCLVVHLHIFR